MNDILTRSIDYSIYKNLENDPDQPRYLTGEEKEDVLYVLDNVKIHTINPDITKLLLEQQKNSVRMQMEDFKICPSKIENLKGWLVNQHYRSIADPKEPVGINSAEAIGAPLTQINLNSFHSSGFAKNVSIEGFKEVFNASVVRKIPITDIHFKQKDLTIEDILHLKNKIIGVTIGDLIVGRAEVSRVKNLPKKDIWWYNLYKNITEKYHDDNIEFYLKIRFNINLLYAYNITLTDIASIIETKSQSEGQNITVVYVSPLPMAEIHIYAVEEKIMNVINKTFNTAKDNKTMYYQQNALIIFYQNVLIPEISDLVIKGIKNISALVPIFINTLDAITFQEPLLNESNEMDLKSGFNNFILEYDSDFIKIDKDMEHVRKTTNFEELKTNVWKIWINNIMLRTSGVNIDKLERLFNLCNITIEVYDDFDEQDGDPYFYNLIKMPTNWKTMLELKPGRRDYIIVKMPNNWKEELDEYYNDEIIKLAKNSGKNWRNKIKEIKQTYVKEIKPMGYIKMKLQQDKDKIANETKQNQNKYTDLIKEIRFDKVKENIWKIEKSEKLLELLEFADIYFEKNKSKILTIKMPDKWLNVLNKYYDNIKEDKKNQIKDFTPLGYIKMKLQKEKNRPKPSKYTDIMRAATYVYAQGIGSNLRYLLAHPLIDPDLTISNNYHEILDCFGIEVTRNYISNELYEMITGGGSNISCKSINLISDVMSSSGYIVPITSKGAAKQDNGPLSRITFQTAIRILIQASVVARDYNNKSASSRIFQGKRVEIGTGGMRLDLRPNILRSLLNTELEMTNEDTEPIRIINGIPVRGIKGERSADISAREKGGENNYDDTTDNFIFESPDVIKMYLLRDNYGDSIEVIDSLYPIRSLPDIVIVNTKIPYLEHIFKNLSFQDEYLPSLFNITLELLEKEAIIKKPQREVEYIDPIKLIQFLKTLK